MHTPNPRHHSLSAFDQKLPDRRKVGDTLTATVTGAAAASYQWFADDKEIEGADEATLLVTEDMLGSVLYVVATAEDGEIATSDETAPVTAFEELALESVEGSQRTATGTNIIVAYFSAPVDFEASDVEIRDVATKKLFTVESVNFSADKMKATMALTGTSSAGTGGTTKFLDDNVDYSMVVEIDGTSYEKGFYIPAVLENGVVVASKASSNQLEVEYYDESTPAWTVATTLDVPDDMTVDYEEILGDTVTVWYNKDLEITDMVNHSASVESAFSITTADNTNFVYTDLATGKEYKVQNASVNQNNTATRRFEKDTNNKVTAKDVTFGAAKGDDPVKTTEYAKITFNANKTIKTVISEETWSGSVLADSVKNTSVVSGKSELNLNGYTIVKDGKTAAIDDVQENDVVFYNSGDKFAEIYTDLTSGELEAVHDGSFTFDGEEYKIDKAYYKSADGRVKVDNDYMNALKAGGEDITIWKNRKGEVIFISGEVAATVSNTSTFIVVDATKAYRQSLANYIRLSVYDTKAAATKTVDIDVSKINAITGKNGIKYENGKTYTGSGTDTVSKFIWTNDAAFQADTAVDLDLETKTAAGNPGAGVDSKDILDKDGDIQTSIAKSDLISLTTDDKGVVTGIDLTNGEALRDTLKSGLKELNGKQISSTCPIYITKTQSNGKLAVTATTYGDFSSQIKATPDVTVYNDGRNGKAGKNVTSIVINNDNKVIEEEEGPTIEMVVESSLKTTSGVVNKLVGYGVDPDTKAVTKLTYTAFKDSVKNDLTIGDIVAVSLAADKKTVQSIANASGLTGTLSTSSVNLGKASFEIVSKTGTPATLTITGGDETAIPIFEVVKATDGTKTLEAASLADLATLSDTNTVSVSYNGEDTSSVDVIVVDSRNTDSGALAAAKTAVTTAMNYLTATNAQTTGGIAGAGDVGLAAYTTTVLTSTTLYGNAKARLDNATSKIAAYEALGGHAKNGALVTADGEAGDAWVDASAYYTRKTELETTGKQLVVELGKKKVTVALGLTAAEYAEKLPEKLTATLANGTTAEVGVTWNTVTTTKLAAAIANFGEETNVDATGVVAGDTGYVKASDLTLSAEATLVGEECTGIMVGTGAVSASLSAAYDLTGLTHYAVGSLGTKIAYTPSAAATIAGDLDTTYTIKEQTPSATANATIAANKSLTKGASTAANDVITIEVKSQLKPGTTGATSKTYTAELVFTVTGI